MRAVCDTGSHPLAVTVVLDGQITVPEPVIHKAEAAASALLRVTAHPFGYRHWTDYHQVCFRLPCRQPRRDTR